MRATGLVRVARTPAHCGEIACISGRRNIAERGMRPALVVVGDPAGDRLARVIQAEEQALVEKLVAHAAIEALAETVLHRLSRRDEMPDDPVVLRPGEHGVRCELGPIVGDDHAWFAAPLDQGGQVAFPRPACVRHGGAPEASPRDRGAGASSGSSRCPDAPA